MSQKEVIELVKKYVTLLNNSGIPVEKAFLYGSYAKQMASDNSDIDVLLVSSIFDSNEISYKTKAWGLTHKINTLIEPYMVGSKRFISDDVSPIIGIVKQEGLEIKI